MAGKLIRAANPGFLTLVNGGTKRRRKATRHHNGGKKMAVRRRRRRRVVARAAPRRRYTRRARAYNPPRRRRRRNYRARVHHRRRRHNPFAVTHHRRRHYRRRRNPGIRGPLTTAVWVVGGSVATEYAMQFVPASVMSIAGGSAIGPIVVKAGVGYGVGWAAHKFLGVSQQHAELLMVGGLTSAVMDAFNIFIQGKLPALFQPKGAVQAAAAPAGGVNGMGAVVGIPSAKYHPYFGWGTGMGNVGQIVGYRDRN